MTIDPGATIGTGCEIASTAIVEKGVVLGDRVRLYHHVVVRGGTILGDGVTVEENAVLGKVPRSIATSTRKVVVPSEPLIIGSGGHVGAGSVLYVGVTIAEACFVGDLASIRERVTVGAESIIGRAVHIECDVGIGSRSGIYTASYICEQTLIEDMVFVAAGVRSASGVRMSFLRNFPGEERGPTLRRGCRIGSAAMLCPRIEVGREAVVAAGSVVMEDVPEGVMVMGNPARVVRKVPQDEYLP
jgi:acetyltransferase-like isoleucine patch superfamily enzyme